MSRVPTLNSCAPAPEVMSTAAATKIAAVINTKISLTMVVIIVLLRYARWTANACRETIRRDYGRCSPRLRLSPDVIAATASWAREKSNVQPVTGPHLFRHSLNTRQPHRCRAREDAFAFPLPFRRQPAALLARSSQSRA